MDTELLNTVEVVKPASKESLARRTIDLSHRLLTISNHHTKKTALLNDLVNELQAFSKCGAVAIRVLDEEGDIPYEGYVGFDKNFYEKESPLSIHSDKCMCINVIKGDIDPTLPFYTKGGSFYMNATTKFLATADEKDKGQTRNTCNQYGFESVALIPIFIEDRIYGLVHLADTHENKVPVELVQIIEDVLPLLASAFLRIDTEQTLTEVIAQEHIFSIALHNIALPFVSIYPDGRLKMVNKAFCEMTGYTTEDLRSIKWNNSLTPEKWHDIEHKALSKLHETGLSQKYKKEYICKNGKHIQVELFVHEVCDARGNTDYYYGFVKDISSRKKFAEILRKSKKDYKNLFENAILGIYRITPDGEIIMANPALLSMLGYDSVKDLARKNREKEGYELQYPRLAFKERLESMGKVVGLESAWKRGDGTTLYVRESAVAVQDENGDTLYYEGTVEDITDRKKAEQELKLDESRLSGLLDMAHLEDIDEKTLSEHTLKAAIELTQSKTGFVGFLNENETQLSLPAYSEITMNGCSMKDKPLVFEISSGGIWASAVRQRKSVIINDYDSYKGPDKKGCPQGHAEIKRFLCVPLFDRNKIVALIAVANKQQPYNEADSRQLTLLMNGMWKTVISNRNEFELRASEKRFRELYEKSPLGYQSLNADGCLIEVNPAWLGLLGYNRDEVIDRSFGDFLVPNHKESFIENFPRLKLLEKICDGQFTMVRKDGSHIDIEIDGKIGYDDHGRFKQTHCVLRDITDHKRIEAERELFNRTLAEQMEELKGIIQIASHDLRTPLVNINGFANELEKDCHRIQQILESLQIDPEPAGKINRIIEKDIPQDLSFITAGTAKIDSLLAALLKLARLGRAATQFESLNVNEIAEEIITAMGYQIQDCDAKINIEKLPSCIGDLELFSEVLSNLINNALKYRNPDRRLIVDITGKTNENTVEYSIQDNGLGIRPEDVPRVFELFSRFNTNRVSGEGLGLTIVKRIMDRHNGTVNVTSKLGKGTTFTLSLPKR